MIIVPPEVPDGYVKQRLVVCAAIRSKLTGDIICGVRHYDGIMHAQIKRIGGREAFGPIEQGFVDQKGVFLNRQEAWKIAEAAGQIRYRDNMDNGTLYSENLY